MDEPNTQALPADEEVNEGETAEWVRARLPRIVFLVTSALFLIYLAFGTVEARIWRFGRLYFEDRDIRHVWAYLGDRLPDMPAQGLISALYWISLAAMIVGTIVGLWLFLVPDDDDPSGNALPESPERSTTDA